MKAVIFLDNINKVTSDVNSIHFIQSVAESIIEFGIDSLSFISNNELINYNKLLEQYSNLDIKILNLADTYNFYNVIKSVLDYVDEEFYLIDGNFFFDADITLMKDFSANKNNVLGLRMADYDSSLDFYKIDNDYNIKLLKNIDENSYLDGYVSSGRYFLKKSLIIDLLNKNKFINEQDFIDLLLENKQLLGLPLGGKFIQNTHKSEDLINNWLKTERKSAQFMDRDGVINKNTGYAFGTDLELLEQAFAIVKRANENNQHLIVVTNQSGVARGYYTDNDVHLTHEYIQETYNSKNLKIDAFYHSPYYFEKATIIEYKKETLTRKPEPGMLLKACQDFKIDMRNSSMIGDNPKADLIKLPYLKCEIVDFETAL
ncbi:MAG: HAD-IIIA family hydrolase [bacterium]